MCKNHTSNLQMSDLHTSSNVISCQCFRISLEPSSTGQLFMATLHQNNRCALHTANPHNTLLLEPRCANTQQLRSRQSVSIGSGHWASRLCFMIKTNSNSFQYLLWKCNSASKDKSDTSGHFSPEKNEMK